VLSSLLPASQPVGEQVNIMAALGHQGKCTLCLHQTKDQFKNSKLGDDDLVIFVLTGSRTGLAITLEILK
jgi:hypothetical protein